MKEALSFEDFVEIGKQLAESLVNGVPWSFTWQGCPVTHENNDLYLISQGSKTLRFYRGDTLMTQDDGTLAVRSKHWLPPLQVPIDHDIKGNPIHSPVAETFALAAPPIPSMNDTIAIPRKTLVIWRELADLNPQDLIPRIGQYLDGK